MSHPKDFTLPPLQAVQVGEHRLEYHDVGAGPALVIVHGGHCTAADWTGLASALRGSYRMILPDGFSYPLDAWAIWRLLDHLGIARAALIGHSGGGIPTRAMYRLRPAAVTALIDADSEAIGPGILARKLSNDLFSPQAAALYEKNRRGMLTLRPHHQGDYASDVTIERRTIAYEREKMTHEQRIASRPAPAAAALDPGSPPRPIDDAGAFITCPALKIITGRGKIDESNYPQAWRDEHWQARNLEWVMVKEAGHWPWLEDRDGFLKILLPFLARHAV